MLPRAVLLTALGVLAGVLLLCARPGEPHTAQAPHHHAASHAVCVSPYDLPGCSPSRTRSRASCPRRRPP